MITVTHRNLFDGYCYGPVELIDVKKDSGNMFLTLKDSVEKISHAEYHECVYWRIDESLNGIRLLLVKEMTADTIIKMKKSTIHSDLKNNSDNIENLLREWSDEGLKFYVHFTDIPDHEYLVVAENLDYHSRI